LASTAIDIDTLPQHAARDDGRKGLPERAVDTPEAAQSKTRLRTLPGDAELMAEEQVPGFKLVWRLEVGANAGAQHRLRF
jgi:hypothetical protein